MFDRLLTGMISIILNSCLLSDPRQLPQLGAVAVVGNHPGITSP